MADPPLPILDELGAQLSAAYARAERPRPRDRVRGWPRGLAGVVAGVGVVGAAAAGSYAALHTATANGPDQRALPPAMRALIATDRVVSVSSRDPDGGSVPPWTLRLARSATGQTCVTVGQRDGDRFGLTGLDGVFRLLPASLVDSCSAPAKDTATLTGQRTFDANDRDAVRTVVYGVGGPDLRAVTVTSGRDSRSLDLGADGSFVAAYRGYVEDSAPTIHLRFADGHLETRTLRNVSTIAADSTGGDSLQTELNGDGPHRGRMCVRFFAAHPQSAPGPMSGPNVCAAAHTTALLAVRHMVPGETGPFSPRSPGRWQWGDRSPGRTVAWGYATGARSATLTGAGPPRPLALSPQGAFLVILPAGTDPAALAVRIVRRTGPLTLTAGSGVQETVR